MARGVRRVQAEGERTAGALLVERLSGLECDSLSRIGTAHSSPPKPRAAVVVGQGRAVHLAVHLRAGLFPLHIAVNKLDLAPPGLMKALEAWNLGVPLSAALRTWNSAFDERPPRLDPLPLGRRFVQRGRGGLVVRCPTGSLGQDGVVARRSRGTGVEALFDEVVFGTLDHIVVYPVQDED